MARTYINKLGFTNVIPSFSLPEVVGGELHVRVERQSRLGFQGSDSGCLVDDGGEMMTSELELREPS